MYQMNQDEFAQVLAFINDDNASMPPEDIAQRFIRISSAFSSQMQKAYMFEKSKNKATERMVERLRARVEKAMIGQDGVRRFYELRLNSLDLAYCIVFLMNAGNIYYSRNKVQYFLYELYRNWLISHEERLTSEWPVAQDWGPHFWSISKKCDKVPPVVTGQQFQEIQKRLNDANPEIMVALIKILDDYKDWSESQLKELMTNSLPYQNAMAKTGNNIVNEGDEKWGHRIKDNEIFSCG